MDTRQIPVPGDCTSAEREQLEQAVMVACEKKIDALAAHGGETFFENRCKYASAPVSGVGNHCSK